MFGRKKAMIFCLIGVLAFLSHVALAEVAVLRSSFVVQIPAGKSLEFHFDIENLDQEEPATVSLYLSDYEVGSGGAYRYLPPGTLPRSCAEWIELDRTQIELPAGESTEVSFTVTVPSETEGSHWAVLFVETEPEPLGEAPETETGIAIGIIEKWRYAIIFSETVPGTEEPDATINSLKIRQDRGSGLVNVTLDFENTGNVIIRDVTGSIDLIDQTGEILDSVAIPTFRILPGSTRSFELKSSKKLPPGVYIARAGIDYGDALASAQRAFMVKK